MTIDLDAMTINKAKFMVDGNKYFELYRKHIPGNISGNILLLSIGNLDCISKIISMNPNAKYLIIDRKTIIKSLSIVYKDIYDIEAIENDDEDLYNIIQELDMKFDCIIMNPPYKKNLHLKILAEAIKYLKDDNSVCVNLSPVRWLQDPFAKYKKNCDLKRFEESIAKHIESIDFIDRFKMTEMFQNCNCDCGVYVCRSSETSFDFSHFHQSELLVRFADLDFTKMDAVLEKDQLDGIRVRCGRYGLANDGGTTRVNANSVKLGKFEYVHFALSRIYKDGYSVDNGKFWSEDRMPGAGNKAKPIGTPIPSSVRFSTVKEARNFVKYTKTNFIRTLKFSAVDVEADADFIVPFLGDVINPRTGLKGYTGEWTDDDLALYFNITKDEQKIIEETIEKYK